jgi:hypothetical protein
MQKTTFFKQLLFSAVLLTATLLRADAAPFDLAGPTLEIKVTRAGTTLPIAQVANLQAGDRVWVHPVFAAGQTAHFLLIAAFLRGATSPPPEAWFTRADTWTKPVRDEGIVVTVPPGARQAVLLLAPQTGGDFSTLRAAVRGKPGVFVRAAQDLYQASLDRSRLDQYLSGVRTISREHPDELHNRTATLARSLNVKLDETCFDKPTAQQAPCLLQATDQIVLSSDQSPSRLAALTTGASADLIGQIGATKAAGGGAYSPYFGAVVDLARILEGLRTASYQYIPALGLTEHERLNLRLNNAPSFRKPMSVLVAGLPPVQATAAPELRAADAKQVYCLQKPSEALAITGSPLLFSTELAHKLVLRVAAGNGKTLDLPVTADALRGALVLGTPPQPAAGDAELSGQLRGFWGFDAFSGPSFRLRSARPREWKIAADEQTALIVGRDSTIQLAGDDAVCVDQVKVATAQDKDLKSTWKLLAPDKLSLTVPLKDAEPGPLTVSIKKFGVAQPDEVKVRSYAEAGRLDHFSLRAGDRVGVLQGTRLDEVASLDLHGLHFVPQQLARSGDHDQLSLAAAASPEVIPGESKATASVSLKDGRVVPVQAAVNPPRPRVRLLSKSVKPGPSAAALRLTSADDLAQDGELSFVFEAEIPASFAPDEIVEIADANDAFHAKLTISGGGLVLQDAKTVVAVLNPQQTLGASAFGPLRFRVVDASGAASDWYPLVRLVRVPELREVRCPDAPDVRCRLLGSSLFLIDAVAPHADFTGAVSVPAGYAENSLTVPRPDGTLLYLKLRDDPATVNPLVLPVMPEPR